MESDRDYTQRVGVEVYEALCKACGTEDGKVVIRTGPAFDALLMVAAVVIAQDPALTTVQRRRQFCEEAARKLEHQMSAVQAHPDDSPPGTVN